MNIRTLLWTTLLLCLGMAAMAQEKIQYDGSKRFGGYRVVKQREDGRDASAS